MQVQIIPKRYLKENHRDYLKMVPIRIKQVSLVLLLMALILTPTWAGGYVLGLLTHTMIAVIGAVGLNFMVGFTGQVSLGQAAYMAVGAYTMAIFAGQFGLPFFAALLIAGLITASASVLVGAPTLHLKGFYLSMATFVFHFIVIMLIGRWDFVGTQSGISVPRPVFGKSDGSFFYVTFTVTALLLYCGFNLERSYLGRAWGAIRDRDLAAAAVGISLARLKLWANAWSGFYAGVAGALFASFLSYISPEHFPFLLTIQYLGMILVGGLGTVLGSVFGAVFMSLIPEGIRFLSAVIVEHTKLAPTFFGDAQLVFFGIIIICTLIYAPKGLFGFWEDTKLYFRTWPLSY